MAAKAIFTWVGDGDTALTKDRDYPAFELFGSFAVINDEGSIIGIGLGSRSWLLQKLQIDDHTWEREDDAPKPMTAAEASTPSGAGGQEPKQPETEGEKGNEDGKEGSGGDSPEGGSAAPTEEGDQAGGKAGKSGKGRANKG